jgi:hypothetical protein
MYGRNHSEETRTKISDAQKGNTNKKAKPRAEGALRIFNKKGKPSQVIEVFDLQEKTTTSYNSKSAAARALNINQTVIVKYFANNQQKPYKGRYTFKKVN